MNLDNLVTERLVGERLRADLSEDVRRFQQDEDYMWFMGGVRSDEAVTKQIEQNLAHWDRFGFGMWVLRDPGTRELMGMGGMRHIDDLASRDVAIGYGFLKAFWGRGLATEIALECVRIARDELHLDTLVARAHPDHAASIHVMEKAGFTYDEHITLPEGRAVVYRAVIV